MVFVVVGLAVPLNNEPQVIAYIHKSLADSIVKAITDALTLHNNKWDSAIYQPEFKSTRITRCSRNRC